MGEEEEDHTMEEVEEEQEVEDFSNSKDTALAGFPNIDGYVKSILKVDDMLRKISNFNTRLAGLLGDRQGVSRSIVLLYLPRFHPFAFVLAEFSLLGGFGMIKCLPPCLHLCNQPTKELAGVEPNQLLVSPLREAFARQ